MVGSRIIKFKTSLAPYCIHRGAFEDETHAFISCPFIQPVWSWLRNKLRLIYPSIPFPSFPLWSQLFGYNDIIPVTLRTPWKLLHAGCLNAI
jgi:hypothetical protein